jgi:ubiquinone/menaquinone biosynthesis C-methylase UbiE
MNESDEKIRRLSQQFFEQELKSYGDVVPPSGQDDVHLVNLLKLLGSGKDRFSLLDIGCGVGYVAKTVRQLYPQSYVCGTDISPEIIALAKKADRPQTIDFKVAGDLDIPHENDTFDFAICRFSIHHYPQMVQHFREVHRILKDKGTYLIIDVLPDEGRYDRWINDLFIKVERDTTGHVKFYTLSEYRTFAGQSGFTIAKVERFPLVLDFQKSHFYFEPIKKKTAEFHKMVSYQEQEDRFSFTLKAAAIFAQKK